MVWTELVATSKKLRGCYVEGGLGRIVEAIPSYNHTHGIKEQLSPSTPLLHSKYIS